MVISVIKFSSHVAFTSALEFCAIFALDVSDTVTIDGSDAIIFYDVYHYLFVLCFCQINNFTVLLMPAIEPAAIPYML